MGWVFFRSDCFNERLSWRGIVLGPSSLECRISRHLFHQMHPRGLELLANQAQVQQKDPEVVLGALGIELPLAAAGGPAAERFGGHRKTELDVGFDLAGMKCAFEPAKLDRASIPDVM
jgi:hypothetical protein